MARFLGVVIVLGILAVVLSYYGALLWKKIRRTEIQLDKEEREAKK